VAQHHEFHGQRAPATCQQRQPAEHADHS
jgi:hypothetical protein